MDLEQRLKQLESYQDWQGVVESLEQGISSAQDAPTKAGLHLRLGRVLHRHFLQGVRALKHFQDAYKQNSALTEALAEARNIYWELGKLNMVQKLLELQLKGASDNATKKALHRELGDVLVDLGDYDRATESYAKALQSSDGAPGEIPELLQDVQLGADDWQDRMGELLRRAHAAETTAEKSAIFLRAARIVRRFAPDDAEGILGMAYAADPKNSAVAATYEGLLAESQRSEKILETQREALKATSDAGEKASAAYQFGARWALRHQNVEVGTQLIEEALRLDPTREEAFTFLRDTWGTKGGDWDRVVRLADELSDRSNLGEKAGYLLAQAGLLTWKERGDLIRARRFFERLARLQPANPALTAFEAQIGESLAATDAAPAKAPEPAAPPSEPTPAPVSVPLPEPVPMVTSVPESSPPPPPAPAPIAQKEPEHVPASAGVVAELREKAAQQEAAKRYHEYVKTLIALGDAVGDSGGAAQYYLQGCRPLREQVLESGRGGARVREGAGRRPRGIRRRSATCARCTRSAATGRS